MTSDDPRCPVCMTRSSQHGDKMHPFGKFEAIKHDEENVEIRQSSLPFDPVLRQALIDKGVLTPDDLRNAENKIRDVSLTIFGKDGV